MDNNSIYTSLTYPGSTVLEKGLMEQHSNQIARQSNIAHPFYVEQAKATENVWCSADTATCSDVYV